MFAAALAYAVSFMPGEHDRRLTAFFILFIIAVSVALSFFEEFRAQKELESLDRLLSFKATVLRDGIRHLMDKSEVVPGEILVLTHGQKIPADALKGAYISGFAAHVYSGRRAVRVSSEQTQYASTSGGELLLGKRRPSRKGACRSDL